MLTTDWSDADLVLATSLCFTPALLALLQARARALLRPGTRLVCMQPCFDEDADDEGDEEGAATKAASSTGAARGVASCSWRRVRMRDEEPTHGVSMLMSFGEASFYVYERTASPTPPRGADGEDRDHVPLS